MHNWLLPEYIEDLLPPQAARMEYLRQGLLNLFRVHGYELVSPPLIEYLDSLLTGAGSDLDSRTFKLVDQLSGRSMGLRADITPQTARIDAHILNRQGVARLCYAGSVIHTLPDRANRSRELMQLGAELYGHEGFDADLEIIRLMLQGLKWAGIGNLHLDIGHVGIFRCLLNHAGISDATEIRNLFAALQAKNISEIKKLTSHLDNISQAAFAILPQLYGDETMLDNAFRQLPSHLEITRALDELRAIVSDLRGLATINIDLGELRGYHYHSGVVFAAYTANHPQPLAAGGRYDEVGKTFGRARPATGFSLDLRDLARLTAQELPETAILAPGIRNAKLAARIAELRGQGEVVIVDLPGHEAWRNEYRYNRRLEQTADGEWVIAPRSEPGLAS